MAIKKKALEESGLTPEIVRHRNELEEEFRVAASAVFCRPFKEPQPTYIKRENETVMENMQGAYVVLGTDNLGNRSQGYGGAGETGCAKIDLVVGRASFKARDGTYVDPMPYLDAARLYISQKTDVDDNFGLVDGKVGNMKTRSAIAIKADGVRVIGKEGVKIVTGVGSLKDTKNSQGGDYSRRGIDLIALNDDGVDQFGKRKLQPLVKGDNLRDALAMIATNLQNVIELLCTFTTTQLEWNAALAAHPHISPFFAGPTSPSPALIPQNQLTMKRLAGDFMEDLVKSKVNIFGFESNFLELRGPSYINSLHNNTN